MKLDYFPPCREIEANTHCQRKTVSYKKYILIQQGCQRFIQTNTKGFMHWVKIELPSDIEFSRKGNQTLAVFKMEFTDV